MLVKAPVLATCLQQMLPDFDRHGVQFPRWSVGCLRITLLLSIMLPPRDIFQVSTSSIGQYRGFFDNRSLMWGTAVVGASVYVVFL